MTKTVIVGSGVVGQATGKGLMKKGNEVVFVDTNIATVEKLNREGFEAHLPSEMNDLSAEIFMFCISTPPRDDGSVNLEYIVNAVITQGKWLSHKKKDAWPLLVIRSTVPIGTTRNLLLPLLEKYSGLKVGKDFGLCMQPEFLRAQSNEEDFLHPWVTVIGQYDQRSGDVLEKMYTAFESKIFRVDLEVAEFQKYVHNCFNATKISFSNEMWLLGAKIGIDANLALEIMASTAEGSWNQGYGTIGGRPYGGTCLPKDTKGLLTFAQERYGIDMPLLSAVISINSEMEELAKQGVVPSTTIAGLKWQPSPGLRRKQKEAGR